MPFPPTDSGSAILLRPCASVSSPVVNPIGPCSHWSGAYSLNATFDLDTEKSMTSSCKEVWTVLAIEIREFLTREFNELLTSFIRQGRQTFYLIIRTTYRAASHAFLKKYFVHVKDGKLCALVRYIVNYRRKQKKKHVPAALSTILYFELIQQIM